MTEHKGLPVKGYQSQENNRVTMVNQNKELEEQVLRVLDDLSLVQSDCDPRWLAIARTNIEQGFMAMNRAIFKPERVSLDDDA